MSDPIGDIRKAIEKINNISHYERVEYHYPRCDLVLELGPCSCIPLISYHPVYKDKDASKIDT